MSLFDTVLSTSTFYQFSISTVVDSMVDITEETQCWALLVTVHCTILMFNQANSAWPSLHVQVQWLLEWSQ